MPGHHSRGSWPSLLSSNPETVVQFTRSVQTSRWLQIVEHRSWQGLAPTPTASFEVALPVRRAMVTRSVSEGTGCGRARPSLTPRVTMSVCRRKAPRATSKTASEERNLPSRSGFGFVWRCPKRRNLAADGMDESGLAGRNRWSEAQPRQTRQPNREIDKCCLPNRRGRRET